LTGVLDLEGVHLAPLRLFADIHTKRVLELGCGDGRLTLPIAAEASRSDWPSRDDQRVARRGWLALARRVPLTGGDLVVVLAKHDLSLFDRARYRARANRLTAASDP
jgi:hypothetical protein